jgi:hypothetical protein
MEIELNHNFENDDLFLYKLHKAENIMKLS